MQSPETTERLKAEYPQYISVDIETSGPEPGGYAMLSIGACQVADETRRFYAELQPDRSGATPEAMAVSRLSLEDLARDGLPAGEAMRQFAAWLAMIVPGEKCPVFVAFNAAFDWMFVNDYFLRYLGQNPFGHSALDIKAYYMGMRGVPWAETSYHRISTYYHERDRLLHHALEDALDQSHLFNRILAERLNLDR